MLIRARSIDRFLDENLHSYAVLQLARSEIAMYCLGIQLLLRDVRIVTVF